jgi:hypothetical protein
MPRRFALEVTVRKASQLLVHERHQALGGRRVGGAEV